MEKEKQVNTQILKKYELCMYGSYCHSSLCILFRIMRIMETKLQPRSSTEHNHYQNQKNKLTTLLPVFNQLNISKESNRITARFSN